MNYVYILRCADGTYYTGWTNHLTRRLAAHNSGKGAKYTAGRAPVELVFSEVFEDRSEALGYEAALKKLTRTQKEQLIASQNVKGVEYLTIVDETGNPCGIRPRDEVHRQGLRHEVVHLWVLEQRDTRLGVWMQQRALNRPHYPGSYDLTATGHMDPGEMAEQSIVREAREEIGLHVNINDLQALPVVRQPLPRPDGGFDVDVVHTFV